MVIFLPRDAERTPLLRPRPTSRSASCGPSKDVLAACDVFNTILMIRQDVIVYLGSIPLLMPPRDDTPVSWQGLTEPALAFNLVRPLTEKYISLSNLAIVYCLLSNRLQFTNDSQNLPNARLNTSRAALCELLAIRVMTHYAKPSSDAEAAALPALSLPSSAMPSPAMRPSASSYSNTGTAQGAHSPSSAAERQRRLSVSARSAAVTGARQRRMSMGVGAGGVIMTSQGSRMSKKRSEELVLANLLIAGFQPFAGAPDEVVQEEEMEGRRGGGRACNALELAIVTNAKRFVACVACQKVLESVWSGRIYYTPSAFFDIVPDRMYKQKAITIYDCRKAPTLDHYRLRVPRYRMLLEMLAFAIVFVLMIIVSNQKMVSHASWWEMAMMVYTFGWAFDRFATTLEHGLRIYAANLWNGIDAAIIFVFLMYLPLRLYGLLIASDDLNDLALSILSCESALLFPRLAFTLMKRNVLVMSLRAMLGQFGVLMLAAVWIFVGFWHALYTLDEGNYTVWEIAEYMTNIWFGLDSTGFDLSPRFHPQLGPIIFFIFACLANTLFLTVVVAILSHTFAELNQDAKAEYMFRHAVAIVEGVKADALFSYQPPLNLLALITLGPASWCLSPRAFHRTHVFFTRLFNAPILLLITIFERTRYHLSIRPALTETLQRALPRRIQELSLFMSGAHGDVYAVFDYAVDTVNEDKMRGEDARWEEDRDEEQAAQDEIEEEDSEDEEGQSALTRTSDGSPVSASTRGRERPRVHRYSNSLPVPPAPPILQNQNQNQSQAQSKPRAGPGIGLPRSRTTPVTMAGHGGTAIPAAALHALDTSRPSELTSGGILASSPETRYGHARLGQSIGQGHGHGSLLFEHLQKLERDKRRASYPPVVSPPRSNESDGNIGGEGRDASEASLPPALRSDSVKEDTRNDTGKIHDSPSPTPAGPRSGTRQVKETGEAEGSAQPPLWVKGLLDSLKRLEERQERLEGMLMPNEGD